MVKFLHIEHIDYISKACKHFWVLEMLDDDKNNYELIEYLTIIPKLKTFISFHQHYRTHFNTFKNLLQKLLITFHFPAKIRGITCYNIV